jgi:hypothetical protein
MYRTAGNMYRNPENMSRNLANMCRIRGKMGNPSAECTFQEVERPIFQKRWAKKLVE